MCIFILHIIIDMIKFGVLSFCRCRNLQLDP